MIKRRLEGIYESSSIKGFLISMLIFGIVTGLYNGVFNNYLHEVLNFSRAERGLIELPRELPGLLLFALLAVLNRFSENRLIRTAFIITAAGLILMFIFGRSAAFAVILMAVYSTGEHLMMPVRQSVGLHLAKKGREGMAMGIIQGFGNAGQAAGFYLGPAVIILTGLLFVNNDDSFLKYRIIFLIAGLLLITGFAVSYSMNRNNARVQRKKIYINGKFRKYYLLEAFFGARKQVFLTFAPYVLITVYGAGPELISVLYGIWSLINIFFGPAVGKLIDRIGYKKALILDAAILIIICLMYGFTHRFFSHKAAFAVICIVFVLDAVMFAFCMARDMYARSLSDTKEELTATLGTGLSVNHLISIVIAVFGGILWERMGIEYLFGFAAVIGCGSFILSAVIEKAETVNSFNQES